MGADGVERGEDIGRGDRDDGRDENDAGSAVEAVKWRDPFSAPLDEGRAAGQEEGHVRPETCGDAVAGVLVELGAPCLQRAIERGCRVR